MYHQTLEQAAISLLNSLSAPSGSVSISSLCDDRGNTILRVFLNPECRYLKSLVPNKWEDFNVICEIAIPPKLQNLSLY